MQPINMTYIDTKKKKEAEEEEEEEEEKEDRNGVRAHSTEVYLSSSSE